MISEPTHIGAYRLLRQLGQGGMGAVYEAIQETIERRVAIKILRPEYARSAEITKRFFNEARAVNRIDHPGLVQIHEYGHLPEGTAYIVMEFLKGETLAQRIRRLGGRVPAHLAVQIVWQIAAALTAAHAKDIFHRDLKPANLMLVPDPLGPDGERVKILDFGIAKLVEDTCQGKTATSLVMGTPTYMSPEQCRGAGTVDGKSDVYSLGVMLFEMLAGRPPFVAEGAGEILGMHLFQDPPPILDLAPDVPPDIAAFTHLIMSKDRAKRPSMRDVLEHLTPLVGGPSLPLRRDYGAAASHDLKTAISSRPASSPAEQTMRACPSDTIAGDQHAATTRHRSPLLMALLSTGAVMCLGLAWLLAVSSHRRHATKESIVPHESISFGSAPVPTPLETRRLEPKPAASPIAGIGSNRAADKSEVAPTVSNTPAAILPKPGGLRRPAPVVLKKPKPTGNESQADSNLTTQVDKAKQVQDGVLRAAREEYEDGHYKQAIFWGKLVKPPNTEAAWLIIGSAACKLSDMKLADESFQALGTAGRQNLLSVCLGQGIEHRHGTFSRAP
jgi:serine/threonine protein kinase